MIGSNGVWWTDEEVQTLRELLEQGFSASQIASVLGTKTRNAVIGKAHRLGIGRGKIGNGGARPKTIRKPAMNRKQTNFNLSLGRKTAPRPPVAARTSAVPITPINGDGITILELRRSQCHAVVGSSRPESGLPRYCGHPAWEHTPYCEGHYAAFHSQPKPR